MFGLSTHQEEEATHMVFCSMVDSYLTVNNAFVSDSTATMTHSLYIQPNVDQATVRVTNSTFLNASVRFESSKAIQSMGQILQHLIIIVLQVLQVQDYQ